MITNKKEYTFNNAEVYLDDNELYVKDDKTEEYKMYDLKKTFSEILEDPFMKKFTIIVESEGIA